MKIQTENFFGILISTRLHGHALIMAHASWIILYLTWYKWLSSNGKSLSLFPRNCRCITQSNFPIAFGTRSSFLLHRLSVFGFPFKARTSIVSAILTLRCCYRIEKATRYKVVIKFEKKKLMKYQKLKLLIS